MEVEALPLEDRLDIPPPYTSVFNPQSITLIFFNAISMGILAPMLFFVMQWPPKAALIGLIFAIDSLGRIIARPVLHRFPQRSVFAVVLLLSTLGYLLIALAGGLHLAYPATLGLIYLGV